MCGRYSIALSDEALSQLHIQFRLDARVELEPRYNVGPSWAAGAEPPIVFTERGTRQLAPARFWMIPTFWKRPLSALPTAFNARSEELGTKPFFRASFERRRCLVPATGWREFAGPRGDRRPHHFHHDHSPFAFAGLWDEWTSPEGEPVRSFAIVTVAASDVVRPVHDRMPLCAFEEGYDAWLDPGRSGAEALEALLSLPSPRLECYEASRVGNDVRREGPEVIAPARAAQLSLF